MKEWEIFAPYLLPRVQSVKKKRNNTLPTKLTKLLPLTDANARRTAWRRSDYFYPEMIPEPDYSESEEEDQSEEEDEDDDEEEAEESSEEDDKAKELEKSARLSKDSKREKDDKRRKSRPHSRTEAEPPGKGVPAAEHPKDQSRTSSLRANDDGLIRPKKPHNPYLESSQRLKLHKELKFSQKYGVGFGNPKSELQVAIEKFTEGKLKRDLAVSRQSSLEKILERQAKKIEMQERQGSFECPEWMTRLQLQQHEPWADSGTNADEFFRVHAKVLNSGRHRHHPSSCTSSVEGGGGSSASGSSGSLLSRDDDSEED